MQLETTSTLPVCVVLATRADPERTDAQVEYINKNVSTPHVLQVIDCGTSRSLPSKYADIYLKQASIVDGWRAGIKELGIEGPFSAYWLLDDSVRFSRREPVDILRKLLDALYWPKIVVVQPSIHFSSAGRWDHLINLGGGKRRFQPPVLRRTWFVDNSAALWKARAFSLSEHLSPNHPNPQYAALETCYKARLRRKKILIHEGITIHKTDINEPRSEILASDKYFTDKYGENWRGKLFFEGITTHMRYKIA